MKSIKDLGFKKNNNRINGFVPHFKKGNDYLFLIGSDYWCSKIVDIAIAFENYNGIIYGFKKQNAPRASDKDWVTNGPQLKLIKTEPLSEARWKEDGSGLEYKKIKFI